MGDTDNVLDEYLTARDAAKVLKISYNTLMIRIRKGKIPSVRKGWQTLIHRDDVARAREDGKRA